MHCETRGCSDQRRCAACRVASEDATVIADLVRQQASPIRVLRALIRQLSDEEVLRFHKVYLSGIDRGPRAGDRYRNPRHMEPRRTATVVEVNGMNNGTVIVEWSGGAPHVPKAEWSTLNFPPVRGACFVRVVE